MLRALQYGYDGAKVAFIVGTSSAFDVAASENIRADKIRSRLLEEAAKTRSTARSSPTIPLLFDYWTEASIVIDYIAKQSAGLTSSKG